MLGSENVVRMFNRKNTDITVFNSLFKNENNN